MAGMVPPSLHPTQGWSSGEVTMLRHLWSWDRTRIQSEYLADGHSCQSGSNPCANVVGNSNRMYYILHTLLCFWDMNAARLVGT